MTTLDFSADVGLLGVVLATANICLGLLIAVRYSPWRLWPHRKINIFAIHRWTAYLLFATIIIHPAILLFLKITRWRLVGIALPVWSPVQPLENTVGAAGLYLIVVVLLTSYFRLPLGRRRWKLFHYLVYAAAVCIFFHAVLADPQLKGMAIDPFDGEKFLIECCILIVTSTTLWAYFYRLRKRRKALVVNERYHP